MAGLAGNITIKAMDLTHLKLLLDLKLYTVTSCHRAGCESLFI